MAKLAMKQTKRPMNSINVIVLNVFFLFMISTFVVCHASGVSSGACSSFSSTGNSSARPSVPSAPCSCPFSGFYTGVAIGESLTTAKINSATIASANIPTVSIVSTNSAQIYYSKKDSWLVAAFAGYGFAFDPFYLGGELFFKISNPKKTTFNALALISTTGPVTAGLAENTTIKTRKLESALDLRAGYYLSASNMLYGRVGASFNTISVNSSLNSILVNAGTFTAPVTQGLLASGTKHTIGLRLGLGMEQSIFKRLSLRLDYIFTQYKKLNLANAQITTTATTPRLLQGAFLDARNIKFFNHSFMLGMNYYW